jgi:anti-sigma factor RsiW
MNCHSVRALLDLHAEGRLSPGRAAKLDAHLAGCAACRALATPPSVTVTAAAPASLKAKLLAAAKAAAPAGPKVGGTLSLLPRDAYSLAFATAAVAAIALGLGWKGAPNQNFDAGDELAGRTR